MTEIDFIANGGFASVSKVEIDGTKEVCALKVYTPKDGSRNVRDSFEKEIQNLRRAKHFHIAGFYAAYLHKRPNQVSEYGILMQPVANSGTLEALLTKCRRSPSKTSHQEKHILRKSFGCLASVLKFLHDAEMRHKDIKPSNILVHNEDILLTDFGSSFDGSAEHRLTTHSKDPEGYTRRYAPPEYIFGYPRNEKSDVFAMGGVFYDTICATAVEVPHYKEHYYEKLKPISTALRIEGDSGEVIESLKATVSQMLNANAGCRPSAGQLVRRLAESHFCMTCSQERLQNVCAGCVGVGRFGERRSAEDPQYAYCSRSVHLSGRPSSAFQTAPVESTGSSRIAQRHRATSGLDVLSSQDLDQILDKLKERADELNLPMPASLDSSQRTLLMRDPEKRELFFGRVREMWYSLIDKRRNELEQDDSDEEDDSEVATPERTSTDDGAR